MFVYRLEDKTTDRAFMTGETITGKAIVDASDDSLPLLVGSYIVVELSGGKKYKAKVLKFEYFVLKKKLVGEISFVKP